MEDILNFNTALFALWIFFILMTVIYLAYYLAIFIRLGFYKEKKTNKLYHPLSVVICAKNEAKNLKKNLADVLDQDYPNFEVIVVNDGSWDGTQEVLEEIQKDYPQLRISGTNSLDNDLMNGGKKFAQTIGIKAAKYEWIVFTDADCKPVSKLWLRKMNAAMTDDIEIVLAYGPYDKQSGFLNQLIRFDTFHVGLQYLSYALAKMPYMGVGRNMAYRKTLFFKHKGFAAHMHIPSGDDDLFVNAAATSDNCAIVSDEESWCFSTPESSFSDWIKQKRRHYNTASLYQFKHKVLLALYPMCQWVFWLGFLLLLVFDYQTQMVLSIFVAKYLIQFYTNLRASSKLGDKSLVYLSPIYELVLLLIGTLVVLMNVFSKPKKW